MSRVIINVSISLDGYVAGSNDSPEQPLGDNGAVLHQWMLEGETPHRRFIDEQYHGFFNTDDVDTNVVDTMFSELGAMVFGRRTYDLVNGWEGSYPVAGVPVHVVTSTQPERVPKGNTRLYFHAEPAQAIRQAKANANGKTVGIAGGRIAAYCLRAGLVDELHLHVVPVLLGEGVPLFDSLDAGALYLRQQSVVAGSQVVHLRYAVENRK